MFFLPKKSNSNLRNKDNRSDSKTSYTVYQDVLIWYPMGTTHSCILCGLLA